MRHLLGPLPPDRSKGDLNNVSSQASLSDANSSVICLVLAMKYRLHGCSKAKITPINIRLTINIAHNVQYMQIGKEIGLKSRHFGELHRQAEVEPIK